MPGTFGDPVAVDPTELPDDLQPLLALTVVTGGLDIFPSRGDAGSATGGTFGLTYEFAGSFVLGDSFAAADPSLTASGNVSLAGALGAAFGGGGGTFDFPDLTSQATGAAGAGQVLGVATGSWQSLAFADFALPSPQESDAVASNAADPLGTVFGGGAGGGAASDQPAATGQYSIAGGGPLSTTASVGGAGQADPAQPFDNLQPSLAVTEVTMATGIFPSRDSGGSATGDMLGFVYDFAGNFAPGGSLAAAGQLLPISQNQALFSLLGTTYGGDGITTFALPNLQGQAVVGPGAGQVLGVETGSATVTLTTAELPPPQGSGQAFDNFQPSLPLETLIAVSGVFPSQGGNSGSAAFIGQIATFAGNFAPDGWMLAAGQLLPIAQYTALFSILGTTYGGNGTTNFALPNLQGTVAVGADASDPLGTVFGEGSTVLTAAELPPNGTPVPNDQPSLAVNYLIATSGIFPSNGGGGSFNSSTPTLGEITAFAGNFAPSGWALADGQLLSIAQNTALFSVIGTLYGGDGITTFALPNLQGRTPIGAGGSNYTVGGDYGSDTTTLVAANIPCYLRGTMILTERGEFPVEELAVGDKVVTISGEAQPIKWIGRRSYGARFVAGNRALLPIRVAAGAVAEGVPTRDLWLSPEHALYVDGVLVPARLLANGATIRQVASVERLEYFHIELAAHELILAEGAPAETFVDCDNRGMFQNGGEFAALYPDEEPASWEFCARRMDEDSAELTAIRRALLLRAEALGLVTRDPDPHLIADGEIVRAASRSEQIYYFAVASGTRSVALASRSAVPAEVYPGSLDGRALGVPVERFILSGAGLRVEIGHDCAALGDGFHDDEAAHRWSDGRGYLPEGLLGCFGGEITIEVHLAASALIYPSDPTIAADPAATDDPQTDDPQTDDPQTAEPPISDGLRGYVDVIRPDRICGWAQLADDPETPVALGIYVGGRRRGRAVANRYRADLTSFGSGRHAFEFIPPMGLRFAPGSVEVRHSPQGAALPCSTQLTRQLTSVG